MDLPPAPTPPVGGNMATNSERTANLLNLLKFSSSNNANSQHQQAQQQAQQQPQQQPQQAQLAQQPTPPSQHQALPDQHQNQYQQHQHQHQPQPSLSQVQYQQARLHHPAPAAADPSGLLAALMRGTPQSEEPKPPAPAPPPPAHQHQQPPPVSTSFGSESPSADTRSYLLNLLNRPKPSQTEQPLLTETSHSRDITPQSIDDHGDSNLYYNQYQEQSSAYTAAQQYQQAQQAKHAQSSDAYVEPRQSYPAAQEPSTDMSVLYQQLMGSLAQSSPQSNNVNASPNTQAFQILKKDHVSSPAGSHASHHGSHQGSQHHDQHRVGNERSPVVSPVEHTRRQLDRTSSLHSHQSAHLSAKQTPPTSDFGSYGSVDKTKETVSEAVHDLADKADRDARDALDRAEHKSASHHAEPVPTTTSRHIVETEWQDDVAVATARSVERKTDNFDSDITRAPRYDSPDGSLNNDATDAVHAIANGTQGVADSWESADQDEIVVIEEKETPPVKVYNFPMKPWISITLQEDTTEPRPNFRDESIMDIARLKKEFDQIDRNLYTASQTYMTYGMSKQGGLRVIRQDDGKDAKAFTDTKDRIFNVAMSVTPSDHDGIHREAIIGTGISGTVYWVQIKDGEKDHIEDAHLEQYGFALPPISSQDGDAPGGVLKTRARASTVHPEYFAVGRGKSINFIWPSYILQNNLFKPGHDRVVDTETLLNQCSLKINTGKAGKDFTFSQDDSVVVSLDKSGRVKFWDVRDLTAVKEGSDPRSPMPAQSSLEVKEPLMTLSSTPEGEKAWPTSVLLLDKQRPYQKRCALRYMIVGMKQNHTLQLWDLALGKPVQEFNLPHSKESDAVCSVMYHAASGMIVIGHPTRNSVYFAHLSAPKYNLKSVSQAEYVQRLVAQDSSIPQPDSTAVISGVREYSFANRGILRSLDILSSPAMVQDADEPTLFELYAMHSKGVACLLIKQNELGWSKDNKVLDAVDAVSEGVVVVSKLKSPVQVEIKDVEASQVRAVTASRGTPKDSPQVTPVQNESAQRGPELATPIKVVKNETKDETPVQSSKENQADKPERKPRKKKSKEPDAAANTTNVPRAAAPGKDNQKSANAMPNGETLDSAVAGIEARLTATVSDTLKSSLKQLNTKIDDSARARDESFSQHQLKLLDQVSEVLNENTQKVLETLIHQQFTDLVVPAVGDRAGKAVSELLNKQLQPNVASAVQKEIQSALPHAVSRSLRSAEFINTIADRVGNTVTSGVQREVMETLTQRLNPILTNIATQSAQRVTGELHQQYQDQLEHMKAQHAADSNKIDQLLSYVTRLTDMVSTMAVSQSSLQAEFLKFKQQPVHELPGISGGQAPHIAGVPHSQASQGYGRNLGAGNHAPSHHGSYAASQVPSQAQQYMSSPQYTRESQAVTSPQGSALPSEHMAGTNNVSALAGAFANQMSKTDAEADHDLGQRIRLIEQAIQEGRLQDAMIQWIQSGREEEIFRVCLSRFPPNKFENLPPLMLLVVIATISKDLTPNPRLKEEIEWIEMAVRAFRDNMPSYDWEKQGFREVLQSTSQTMQLLISRLRPLISAISDGFPTDPFLGNLDRGKLEWIVRSSDHILESFAGSRRYD